MKGRERFLRACRREPVDATPVWFMRQAGRFLPEYRSLRERHSVLELAKTPELAAEVSLMPLARFDVDAAILFADIILPLEPMGLRLDIPNDVGPVIHNPVRTGADVQRLRAIDAKTDLAFVVEAVRILRREIRGERALIGFSGAPFTLASYVIEGGPTKTFEKTRAFMHGEPDAWHALLERLATVIADYLAVQVGAGVDVVQLFDSWAGALTRSEYERFAAPYTRTVLERVREVPTIHFATNAADLLALMSKAGGDVISVDWRTAIDEAWRRAGPNVAIQGNLDPAVLAASPTAACSAAAEILGRVAGRPGHIFNLGHGVLPKTPPENAQALASFVHEESLRRTEAVAR